MIVICFTMWTIRLMPLDFLRGGCITFSTVIPSRSVTQIAAPPKYRQISDQDPLVMPMHLPYFPSTAMAARFRFCALNCDDQFTLFVDLGLQHFHIVYPEGYADLRFRHTCFLSVCKMISILSYPYIWGGPWQFPESLKCFNLQQLKRLCFVNYPDQFNCLRVPIRFVTLSSGKL
jgi:hypothetical protein